MSTPHAKRRGAKSSPPNRFQTVENVPDFEHSEADEGTSQAPRVVPTQFLRDNSRSIISENHSPDVGFRYSLNPYRGCEHGCAYCYARPTHEYLDLNAGIDFETRIFVKHDAAELFRAWLNRPGWEAEVVCFSGVTDCYQPAERRFRLTRACLEVALDARQPVSIVTKNALVIRDLDVLIPLAKRQLVNVNVSVTTLDAKLAREMEPRTTAPSRRLETIRQLSEAGINVRVMCAPVIPGLNDREIPQILQAAADAGAKSATYLLLRLPLSVEPVFLNWLEVFDRHRLPDVVSKIRGTRAGRMNDSEFGSRFRGSGHYADQIRQTFEVFARRNRLQRPLPELDFSQFRPRARPDGQLRLFD